jgi:O-antigen/teichoic acid export membrane protein
VVAQVSAGSLRRLAWQVLVYGSGRLGLQLFSLITLPVLTRVFTPAEYGIVETVTTLAALVAIIATLALNSAVQRSYFDYTGGRERRTVVSTGLWASLAWSSLLCLSLATAAKPLSNLLFGTSDYWDLIALALAAIPLVLATTYFQDVLRLLQQPARYVLISFLLTGLTVAFVLWLVLVRDMGIEAIFLGALLAAPLPLVVAWWFVRGTLGFAFSIPELRVMLAYALPLLPVAAATWVMQFADRFFVLHYTTTTEVGLYGVGVRLSNVLMFAVIAFGVAWAPFILDLHSRDAAVERVVRARAFAAVGIGLGFGAVCLGVWSREFFRTITDPSFEDAYKVVGLLLGSVVALGLNGVTMTGISITRQTKYFAYYAGYTSVLNIGLNFLLIPPFGMVGAAAATFATYAVLAWLYYARAQSLDAAPFDLRSVLGALALAAVLIAAGSSFSLDSIVLSSLAKLPLVLVYPVVVWKLGWFRLSGPLFRLPARA